ncbi:hypothetical protein ACFL2E_09100 [Thermodesulfobacteriota bacterium]
MGLKAVETRKFNLDKRIKDISKWKITTTDKRSIKKFVEEYKAGRVTGQVGHNIEATVEKVLQQLRPAFENISQQEKHTISKFTKKDVNKIKKFTQQLLDGKIGNYVTSKPYPKKTIKQIFLALSLFLEWKFKDKLDEVSDDGVILVKPLKVKIKIEKRDPKYLIVDEILQLYKSCRTARERYFIANLFSSGQRAKEFHNNRYVDIHLPEKDENFAKLQVRKEFTKTNDRKIPLFFKKSLEATREFLEERENENIKPTDPIMDYSYDTMRKWLKRLGSRVLNKNVNYQLFRSSCAKWLVDVHHYTKYQLCYFMGWDFSSPMADIYINRSSAILQDSVDKAKDTEIEELGRKLEKQEYDLKLQQEKSKEDIEKQEMKILKLEKAMKDIKNFDNIAVNLFENKNIQKALIEIMLKKGLGKQLMEITGR